MTFIERIKKLLGRDGGGGANGAHGMPGPMPGMMACEEAMVYLYEYLDGELDHAPADQVRAHFEVCKRCYPHLKLEEAFLDSVQRAAEGCDKAPASLRERITIGLAAEEAR